VLEDGTRVITQRGMFVALGMNKNPSRGQTAIDNKPGFLSASNLNQFISEELRRSWTPIPFRLTKGSGGYRGNIAFGYNATILPLVCHVYLDAKEADVLTKTQKHIASAAKIIERGFSIVGIVALVDEATGYQEVRDRQALQEVLRQYITGALFEWTKTFPLEFYKEIFRLKNWQWNAGKMPGVVGTYTKDLVYSRLAPGVLNELERLNPPSEAGYRKHKHHQYLTRDVGHPVLSRRLFELIGMARASESWEKFYRLVERTFPKMNSTLLLPIPDPTTE
jgi:P63C domain